MAGGKRVQQKLYTDDEMAAALEYLKRNGWISEAPKGMVVPVGTMNRRTGGEQVDATAAEEADRIREGLLAKLEGLAHKLVDALSEKIGEASLKDAAATLALVIDKMRLLKEEPTVISRVTDRKELIEVVIERTMERFPGTSREEVEDSIRTIRPELLKLLN